MVDGICVWCFEFVVWMIFEMGKNCVEVLGEIEEIVDLIVYYID